jgi:hypothetical protein
MRHHGGVTSACIHGFAPGTCLICQTLNVSPDGGKKKAKPVSVAERGDRPMMPAIVEPAGKPARAPKTTADRRRGGPRVVPKEAPRTGSALFKLVTMAIVIVVVIAAAWLALHLVFAVIRILELVGVALVAGYVGWLAGVHHERKEKKS